MRSDSLDAELARLATDAPHGLLPNVLVGTGIADGVVRRSSVLGDVLVAFGNRGVTALDLAEDPRGFVSAYEHRFHRQALLVSPPNQPGDHRLRHHSGSYECDLLIGEQFQPHFSTTETAEFTEK